MKFYNSLLVMIAVALCSTSDRAQSTTAARTTTTLAAINSYTAEIDRFMKKNPKARIFGDVSSAITGSTSDWREFKNAAERERAETGENLNESALVWSREGKIVGANFTFTSPSGDWAHLIMYYFREDGSLAKIEAQLNTFHGEISVVRDQYYDPQGKLLKSTRKFLDLKTQKPKKPGEFMDNPIQVYHKVAELPFRRLL